MRLRFLVALAILFVIASACSYNHSKHQDEPEDVNQEMIDNPDFAAIQSNIIGPKCLQCHGRNNPERANFEGYDNVRSHLSGSNGIISRVLVLKDMPKGGSLGKPFDEMLRNWANNSAPYVVTQRIDKELANGANDFARIRDHFFVSHRCTDCHGDFQPMADLNLLEYEQAKKVAMKLLVRLIAEHNHPPEPYPAVSEKEKEALLQWVDAGMPK